MANNHTERLLENAERRVIVLERICKQQEIDIVNARNDANKAELVNAEFRRWHSMSKWKKIGHLLGICKV